MEVGQGPNVGCKAKGKKKLGLYPSGNIVSSTELRAVYVGENEHGVRMTQKRYT
jgi:hypothetical protein